MASQITTLLAILGCMVVLPERARGMDHTIVGPNFGSKSVKASVQRMATMAFGCDGVDPGDVNITCEHATLETRFGSGVDCTEKVPVKTKVTFVSCPLGYAVVEDYRVINCKFPNKWDNEMFTCDEIPTTEATTTTSTTAKKLLATKSRTKPTTKPTNITKTTTKCVTTTKPTTTTTKSLNTTTTPPLNVSTTTIAGITTTTTVANVTNVTTTTVPPVNITQTSGPNTTTAVGATTTTSGITTSTTFAATTTQASPAATTTTVSGTITTPETTISTTTVAGASTTSTVTTTTVAGTTTVIDATPTTTTTGTSTSTVAPVVLPEYTHAYENRIFRTIHPRTSVTKAQTICQNDGATLTSFSTQAKLDHLIKISSNVSRKEFLVGMNDKAIEGIFVNDDGSPTPTFLTMQTNNGNAENKDCAIYRIRNENSGPVNKLIDIECNREDQKWSIICEKNA